MDIKRGIPVYNTATGEYGLTLNIPILFDTTRQWNVPVQVPGNARPSWWHVDAVVCADMPYRAVSVGDTVLIEGRKGTQMQAEVAYINRNFTTLALVQGNKVTAYKGPIFAAMPKNARKAVRS